VADYEQFKDGVVVGFNFDWFGSPYGLQGRWFTGGYSPFASNAATLFSNASLGAFTASHPLMAGVTTLNAFYRSVVSLASGAKSVAKWNDGQQLIAYQILTANKTGNAKRAVGVNAYVGDAAGNWSGDFAKVIMNAAHWLSPLVDQVAPEGAAISKPSAAFQTTNVFPVSWKATDPGSGIQNYDVIVETAPLNGGFGAFVPFVTGTTKKSANFTGTPGTTVCFEVRARDKAGNVSAYSAPKCTAVPLDDVSLTRGGTWSTVSGSQYYMGSASHSTSNGSTLTSTTAQAKRVAIIVTKCPTCGSIQVYFNGTLRGTFSLTSASTLYGQLITVPTFASVETGTLQIVVSSASGNVVEIDGVGFSRV
jgi:hypothetical protein